MTTSNGIIEVTDDNSADEVERSERLAMVDFWAKWCAPCRMVAPIVEELSEAYRSRGLMVGKVDVDANPSLQVRYGVRSIPTILFFKGGKVVDRVVGLVPRRHIEEKILQQL